MDWKFIKANSEVGKKLIKFLEVNLVETDQEILIPVNIEELEDLQTIGLDLNWQDLESVEPDPDEENIAFMIGNRTYLMTKKEFLKEIKSILI